MPRVTLRAGHPWCPDPLHHPPNSRISATTKKGRGAKATITFADHENPRMRRIAFQIGLMGNAVFELTVADVIGAATRER